MRKVTILLAAVALAASPSFAMAAKAKHKAVHHAKAHHAKTVKVAKPAAPANPNENTFKLFNNMFAGR